MKFSVLSTAGIFAAAVSAKKPCNNKCRRAIVSDTPLDLGQAFCSSFLSIEPLAPVTATVTVTHDEVVTTTHSNTETTTTTAVTTPTTVTVVTGTVTQYAKRAQSSGSVSADPVSASILSVCNTKSALISRICSSVVVPASAATSTLTLETTATTTTVAEYTTTTLETTTDTVTATSSVAAVQSIQPILNGDFNGADISPWISSAGETGGKVEYIRGGNVCVDTASSCHSSTIIRMAAPVTGQRYVAISQTFSATPSTTYKLSILLNSRYGGSSSVTGIQARYQGADLGTYDCNKPDVFLYFRTVTAWEFTTDATGIGKLEIRVMNRGGGGSEYNYLDEIKITRK